jgi:hypothetical protein
MNLMRPALFASLFALSSLSSAALTLTTNGFIDSTTNLEWLTPSLITSFDSYNAYSAAGWQVATMGELNTILTGGYYYSNPSYQSFDSSLFNAFGAIADSSGNCDGVQSAYCVKAWVHNVGTNGADLSYEFETIALVSNPAQSNPLLVSQNQLDIGTFAVNSTIGSYPLYGFGDSYSTFMVKAVPLPSTAWVFLSALSTLVARKLKRRATKSV